LETTCPGAERPESGRRGKPDYCEQQDRSQTHAHILNKVFDHSVGVLNKVNCIYFNARSLRNKMPELLTTVEALKPDIIGVSESWGNSL